MEEAEGSHQSEQMEACCDGDGWAGKGNKWLQVPISCLVALLAFTSALPSHPTTRPPAHARPAFLTRIQPRPHPTPRTCTPMQRPHTSRGPPGLHSKFELRLDPTRPMTPPISCSCRAHVSLPLVHSVCLFSSTTLPRFLHLPLVHAMCHLSTSDNTDPAAHLLRACLPCRASHVPFAPTACTPGILQPCFRPRLLRLRFTHTLLRGAAVAWPVAHNLTCTCPSPQLSLGPESARRHGGHGSPGRTQQRTHALHPCPPWPGSGTYAAADSTRRVARALQPHRGVQSR